MTWHKTLPSITAAAQTAKYGWTRNVRGYRTSTGVFLSLVKKRRHLFFFTSWPSQITCAVSLDDLQPSRAKSRALVIDLHFTSNDILTRRVISSQIRLSTLCRMGEIHKALVDRGIKRNAEKDVTGASNGTALGTDLVHGIYFAFAVKKLGILLWRHFHPETTFIVSS